MKMFDLDTAAEKGVYAMPYFGGKSVSSNQQTGKWINSLMPMRKGYVEPFAGMLGVLLQRKKSEAEIVNDRCRLITAFWRCLRDRDEHFLWKVRTTPHCRDFLKLARSLRADMDRGSHVGEVDRAWVAYTLLKSSFRHEIGNWDGDSSFRIATTHNPASRSVIEWERFLRVAKRIEDVQIENTDAISLLNRIKHRDDLMIYADPPYLCQNGKAYGQKVDDWKGLHEALSAQKGLVAVSGYDGDHDALGWLRMERETTTTGGREKERGSRVECLWVNYEPEKTEDLFNHAEEELTEV